MQNHSGTFRAFFATLAAAAFLALTLSSCAVTVAMPGGGSTTTPITPPRNTGTSTGGSTAETPQTPSSEPTTDSSKEEENSGEQNPANKEPSEDTDDTPKNPPEGTPTDPTPPKDPSESETTPTPSKPGDGMNVPEGYTYRWTLDGNTLVLVQYKNSNPCSTDLEFPTGGRYKIGDRLLNNDAYGAYINGIVIPDDVIAIGKGAFQDVTIFNLDAKMYELTIPQSVAVIGEYAFAQTAITKLTLKGNYSAGKIGESAFAGCMMLENVVFEGTIDELPKGIFSGSGIKNITLPTGVKTIGSKAFENSTLETIYIPKTVKSIDSSAFENCYSLEAIQFGGTDSEWADCSKGLLLDECVTVEFRQPEPTIDTPAVELLEKLFSIFL